MARLACPSCGRAREVPEERVPARSFPQRCPGCGTRFEVDGELLRALAGAPGHGGARDLPDPPLEAAGAAEARFPAPTGGAALALAAGTVLLVWSQATRGLLAADVNEHDWWNLLGMLGLRHRATLIGGAIAGAGWAAQVAAPAWVAWRWLAGRRAGLTAPGSGGPPAAA